MAENDRAERLARQLRANLRRRKGQARARSVDDGGRDRPGDDPSTDDAPGAATGADPSGGAERQ